MKYRVTIAACVLLALLAGSAARATEGVKIAVVDVARVSDECKYRADYGQRLEDLIESKRDEGRRLSLEVKARFEQFEKEKLLLTEEAKAEKQRELTAEARKLQEFDAQAKQDVQQQGRAYSEEFSKKIKAVIEEVAAEHGLDLVFDSGVLLYQKDMPDLTDEVLARLDEMFDKEHGVTESDDEEAPSADSDEGR